MSIIVLHEIEVQEDEVLVQKEDDINKVQVQGMKDVDGAKALNEGMMKRNGMIQLKSQSVLKKQIR